MKPIIDNPYLALPFGTSVMMILLETWSFFQSDPLVINQLFLVFLLSLPVLVAFYLAVAPRLWDIKIRAGMGYWVLRWIASTFLVLVVALTVYLAWGFVLPYRTALTSSTLTDTKIATYNYLHFGYSSYDRGKQRRVAAGKKALDKTLYDLTGNTIQLSQLWKEKPIVVEFGSITCPVFTSKIPPMDLLAKEYSGRVDFYVLYVREVHPGQNYPPHASFAQKLSHVDDLKRLEGVERTILVDSLEGAMHIDYGALPNSTYIIGKDGFISYRADWTDPDQVKSQLEALLKHDGYASQVQPMDVSNNFVRPTTGLMMEIYEGLTRSGFAAVADWSLSFSRILLARLDSDDDSSR